MADDTEIVLLDERQAAERLTCSVAFLRRCRLLKTGPLFVKLGRLVRYRLDDLRAYIEANVQSQERLYSPMAS